MNFSKKMSKSWDYFKKYISLYVPHNTSLRCGLV